MSDMDTNADPRNFNEFCRPTLLRHHEVEDKTCVVKAPNVRFSQRRVCEVNTVEHEKFQAHLTEKVSEMVRSAEDVRAALVDQTIPRDHVQKLIDNSVNCARLVDVWFKALELFNQQWDRELCRAGAQTSETLKLELEATQAAERLAADDLSRHTVTPVGTVPVLATGVLQGDLETRVASLQQNDVPVERVEVAVPDDTSTDTDNTNTAIAVERVRGCSLQQLLANTAPFANEQEVKRAARATVALMTPICQLVKRLHENEILHNDIAPGNLMFSSSDDTVCDRIEACTSLGEFFELFHHQTESGSIHATLIDYGEASLSGRSRLHPKGCEAARLLASGAQSARDLTHRLRQARLDYDTDEEDALLPMLRVLREPFSSHEQPLCFTPGYCAPEAAALGLRSVLSDGFSMGAVLRSMLFGVGGSHCGDYVELADEDEELEELRRCEELQLSMWARLLHVDGAGTSIEDEVDGLSEFWLWRHAVSRDSVALLEAEAPQLVRALESLLNPQPLCRGTVQEVLSHFEGALSHADSDLDNDDSADTSTDDDSSSNDDSAPRFDITSSSDNPVPIDLSDDDPENDPLLANQRAASVASGTTVTHEMDENEARWGVAGSVHNDWDDDLEAPVAEAEPVAPREQQQGDEAGWSDIENDQNWANIGYPWRQAPPAQRAVRAEALGERGRNNIRDDNDDNRRGGEENGAAREEPVAPREYRPDEAAWLEYVQWREEPVVARVPLVERRNVRRRRINRAENRREIREGDSDTPPPAPVPLPEQRPPDEENAENDQNRANHSRQALAERADNNQENRRARFPDAAAANRNAAAANRNAAAANRNAAGALAPRRLNLRPAPYREYEFGRPRARNRLLQRQPRPVAGVALGRNPRPVGTDLLLRPVWANPDRFLERGVARR